MTTSMLRGLKSRIGLLELESIPKDELAEATVWAVGRSMKSPWTLAAIGCDLMLGASVREYSTTWIYELAGYAVVSFGIGCLLKRAIRAGLRQYVKRLDPPAWK